MEKVLLVTGASSEVGVQLVYDTYKEYNCIYLQYRNMNEKLRKLVSDIENKAKVVLIQADFSDKSSISNMIEEIKSTGNLPNQIVHFPAPKIQNKHFHKDKWENYEKGWEISVGSIVKILQAFIPNMSKQHYGRIVFMLTSYTANNAPKYLSSYVTVKYALWGLLKCLSSEYISKGITVNGVSPDMMETKFLSEIPQLIVEQNALSIPIGRNIYIKEVIPIIHYMLSDEGAAMTGQNIVISGGGV